MTSLPPNRKIEAERECLDSLLCRRYEQAESDGTPLEESLERAPIVVPKNSVLSDNRGDPAKILSTAEAAQKLKVLDKTIAARENTAARR